MVSTVFAKGKRLLSMEQSGILSTAVLLMVLNLITKFAGFFFLAIAASTVGANRSSDIFFAANTLPELISNVILFGAISVSVVPVLIDVLNKEGEKSFLRVLNSIMNMSLLFFSFIGILLAVFARDIFPFFLQNVINPIDPFTLAEIEEIVNITRVLLIPQIVLGISTFVSSGLYSKNRIILPQIAPLFYNFGRIVGTLLFVSVFHMGIWGLVWSTLVGSIFHLIVQLPIAQELGIRYLTVLDLKSRAVREAITLGIPRVLSIATEQIALTVDQFIALGLVAGSTTTFYFAVRLISIPLAVFGSTFATAVFPSLSDAFSKRNMSKFSVILHSAINNIFFLAIPTSVVLLVLRVPLVRLTFGIFDKSTFGFDSTYMTAWIVLFFSFGLGFESLRTILYRTFYAAHDSIRPFFSAVFVVVGGIITGILFTNYFSHFDHFSLREVTFNFSYFFSKAGGRAGVGGLALSSSLIYFIEFVILILMLNKRIIKVNFKNLIISFGKKFFSAIVMGLLLYSLFKLWDDVLDVARTINLFILTSSTIISGLMVYVWISYLLNDEDVSLLAKLIRKIGGAFKKSGQKHKMLAPDTELD
ncbi:hypothetical protein JW796_02260 [Candidatus Dojkabacteria bacterium]|nr:hypothetical protein [Candidatus Dojkabacteria bacterium]